MPFSLLSLLSSGRPEHSSQQQHTRRCVPSSPPVSPPDPTGRKQHHHHHNARPAKSSRFWPNMAAPRLSILHVSVVLVLAVFSVLLSGVRSRAGGGDSASASSSSRSDEEHTCGSHGIASPSLLERWPNQTTGILNATLAIIPIPLATARRLIPPQYGILEHAYRALVPDFPAGMYPVLVQAAHDTDVQLRSWGITLDDFSRVGFEFPFLDLLGDGRSVFRWAPAQLISASNTIAVEGSRAYGTRVSAAVYDPPCGAFRRAVGEEEREGHAGGGGDDGWDGEKEEAWYFRGFGTGGRDVGGSSSSSSSNHDTTGTEEDPFVEMHLSRVPDAAAAASPFKYPLDLFVNITNQPTFANSSACDNMIRLFGTALSAPVAVRARVRAAGMYPFDVDLDDNDGDNKSHIRDSKGGDLDDDDDDKAPGARRGAQPRVREWADVYGIAVVTPFVENNYLGCDAMREYDERSGPMALGLEGAEEALYHGRGREEELRNANDDL